MTTLINALPITSHLVDPNTIQNRLTAQDFVSLVAKNYKFAPNDLIIVEGNVDFSGWTGLTSLPERLYVNGNLYLDGCTNLISLSEELYVKGTLRGSVSLTSLPKKLYVGCDLVLSYCTKLTSLSGELHVGGRLLLDFCSGLTSLPDQLYVGMNLYLLSCTSLTSLPAKLYVGDSLYLSGCISLISLPPGLRVAGDLFLTRCIKLASLPQGLFVGGSLNLVGCISLVFLPEELDVGDVLSLFGCINLLSLPQKLYVGGNINMINCISLASLPDWITTLGLTSDQKTRAVYLIGTGLSEQTINELRQTPAPDMRFCFSQVAPIPKIVFASLDQALNFWNNKTTNPTLPLPELTLAPDELTEILEFLFELTTTAEYKNIQSRGVLANRVLEAFKFMAENKEIKKLSIALIHEGLTSCTDRIISALDEIELLVNIHKLKDSKDETELRELGKRYLMLKMVDKKAKEHIATFTYVDEIEVLLAFQTVLGPQLNLPGSTRNMLHRGEAEIKTKKIRKIGKAIEKKCTPEKLERFLSTWDPWIRLKRSNAVRAYKNLDVDTTLELQEEYTCSIGYVLTEEPVKYDKKVYDYKAFVKWYLDHGTDIFTRQPIDFSKLVRIALPLSSKESKEEIDPSQTK